MRDLPIATLAPVRLAGLLDVDPPARWSDRDAAAALRHQFAAPLLPDLALAPAVEIDRLRALAAPHTTFLDLLSSPVPALELLLALKDWARHVRDAPESPLAGAPATVLYYAAIAAARVRLNQRITSLPDTDLRTGWTWALTQTGTPELAQLFTAAVGAMASAGDLEP
jgi:hypothetical protein